MKVGIKIFAVMLVVIGMFLGGCASAADTASYNLSTQADNFQITRRITFYNGITGEYILVMEGLCSLGNNDAVGEVTVTCKTGEGLYKKHFLGLSDNVTYFAEQIDAYSVDPFHYKVIMRPETLLPDIDLVISH